MSVKLFCKECDNDGSPGQDGRGGFEFEMMTSTMFNMSSYKPDVGNSIGHEPIDHPINALFESHKENKIVCLRCGSHHIDLICETDLDLERQEQQVLDEVDVGQFAGDIVGEIQINDFDEQNTNRNNSSVSSLVLPEGFGENKEKSSDLHVSNLKLDLED